MMDNSFTLNSGHQVRYFSPEPGPARALNRARKWIKENPDIEVVDISIGHWWSDEDEEVVWEVYVTFLGGI